MTKSNNKDNTLDKFLVNPEDADENATYVKPNIEVALDKHKRQACRDIVLEIRNFGISQRQLVYLIYLLALELENTEVMRALTEVVGENRDKVPVEDSASKKKKLILPS